MCKRCTTNEDIELFVGEECDTFNSKRQMLIEETNKYSKAYTNNKSDCYVDKENLKQYVNTLEGLIEQDIPPFDDNISLADNAMVKVNKHLYYLWDFGKNKDMNIYDITKAQRGKCWWICPDCGSSYLCSINTRNIKAQSINCSYCSGRKANHTNSLSSRNPKLASEWHPTKNDDLLPTDITYGKNKKVWWLGKCGHEWEAGITYRHYKNQGCPYCAKFTHRVLRGFNDAWTTHPELAKLLVNPEDGYKYTKGSNAKVDWLCPYCGNISHNKTFLYVYQRGIVCHTCSDGISFGERYVANLLYDLQLYFEKEKRFEWSNGKRYDYYIPSLDTIIEVHGMQHYEGSFKNIGGRDLQEEMLNDKLKLEMANDNGIEKYIIIDCRHSELEWIKNSILNSELSEMFDLSNVDWVKLYQSSLKPLVVNAWELWSNGERNYNVIADKLKVKYETARRYISRGLTIGLIEC